MGILLFLPKIIYPMISMPLIKKLGEIFHEIMREMEEGIDCHDFTIRCYLGENCAKAWKEEKWEGATTTHADYHHESEFQWALFLDSQQKW